MLFHGHYLSLLTELVLLNKFKSKLIWTRLSGNYSSFCSRKVIIIKTKVCFKICRAKVKENGYVIIDVNMEVFLIITHKDTWNKVRKIILDKLLKASHRKLLL